MNRTKVVIIGQADFAGSAYQAANAVNSLGGEFFVRHISMQKHPFGFPYDIIIPCHQPSHPGTFAKDCDNFGLVIQLLEEVDIIHVWNDIPNDPKYMDFEKGGINIPLNKPTVVTMTGSLYRNEHVRLNTIIKDRGWRLVVQDPMLKFPNEIDSTFIPHAINTKYLNYSFSVDSKLIGTYEYPLTHARGVDVQKFITFVKEKLPEWPIYLVGKTGKIKWKERMDALSKCGLFFQDFNPCGYWGRSALESCSKGIPTFAPYADKAVAMSEGKLGDIPIIRNVTWDNLEKELFRLVENNELRETLSIKTRKWVEEYFSYETIGKMYTKMYEEIL